MGLEVCEAGSLRVECPVSPPGQDPDWRRAPHLSGKRPQKRKGPNPTGKPGSGLVDTALPRVSPLRIVLSALLDGASGRKLEGRIAKRTPLFRIVAAAPQVREIARFLIPRPIAARPVMGNPFSRARKISSTAHRSLPGIRGASSRLRKNSGPSPVRGFSGQSRRGTAAGASPSKVSQRRVARKDAFPATGGVFPQPARGGRGCPR